MQFKTFTLDPFQEEAINAIENNFSVVVSAPTGSGKTLIADFIIEKHRNDPHRIIYTAPIKALSNQKYKDFSREYGEENVGLMTGDIVINPTAKIVIMTTEIYRNMVISNDPEVQDVVYVIFDEIHFINDIERGYVWEESIIYSSARVRFLCLSATIPNAEEFSRWISSIKGHTVRTIVATRRSVPLKHLFYDYELGITSLEDIQRAVQSPDYKALRRKRHRGKREKFPEPNHVELIKELTIEKIPCFFFTFSRKDTQQKALELSRARLFPRKYDVLESFSRKLKDAPSEVSKLRSTQILRETLPQGIAFHHAGLLPVIKSAIEDLFGEGKIKVLYTTETFAVGINMPAKTVCFTSLRKFDGRNFRSLNTKEYFQIAGRAGRRGIDTVGYVVSMIYRPTFNEHEVRRLTAKDVEPIKSQFRLSVNTVLNLINQHPPPEIERILRLSFFSYQKFGEKYKDIPVNVLLARYNNIVRLLRKLGYVEVVNAPGKVHGVAHGDALRKASNYAGGYALTWKGLFSSKVYADEITLGEIFAAGLAEEMDEYQILLAIACLVYEGKEREEFRQLFRNEQLRKLKGILRRNDYLSRERKFLQLDVMTALIHPLYHGQDFFAVLKNTTLLEGDLIRFYAQVLDRLGQIRKATDDERLKRRMERCREIIEKGLEGIYMVG